MNQSERDLLFLTPVDHHSDLFDMARRMYVEMMDDYGQWEINNYMLSALGYNH